MKCSHTLSVGIDISKAKFDACIIKSFKDSGNKFISAIFPNDRAGIGDFAIWMTEHGVSNKTPILLESTGDYHLLVCVSLQSIYPIYCANPLVLKKHTKSSIRSAKTDKLDAKMLAEALLLSPDDYPLFISHVDEVMERKIVILLAKLQKIHQQLNLTLKNFKETQEKLGYDVLSLETIETALKTIHSAITEIKIFIVSRVENEGKKIPKIEGISIPTLALLLIYLKGKCFENPHKLTAFIGMDICVKESGIWRGKQRLSKRGNAYLRKLVYLIGWGLKSHNEDYKKYYEKLYREKKKHYHTAILATGRRFIRTEFFRIQKNF